MLHEKGLKTRLANIRQGSGMKLLRLDAVSIC